MPTRVLKPLQEFLRLESAGGIVLAACAAAALVVANSPLAGLYTAALAIPVEVRIGAFGIDKPLLLWVNDGLMAVFFFLVGLELKREVVEGHLSTLRQATLPLLAAVGGMAVPAGIYAAFNLGDPVALNGWAIPAATDIAFALGVLSLLGPRVPAALKAFLLSVAIFDDIGAIVIIALFYSGSLSGASLATAAVLLVVLAVLNRAGVMRPAAYFIVGVPLWVAVLKSGVHATLAGVALAMFIPIRPAPDASEEASPLHHLEHTLHPWVAFGVLPVFAFVNAGVPLWDLSLGDVLNPVPLGIIGGLFIGKQAGVLAFSWMGIRAGVASRPDGVSWPALHGAALLCGIGFTMSLFIASLAFEEAGMTLNGLDRLGILIGSLLCAAAGYLVLRRALAPEARG